MHFRHLPISLFNGDCNTACLDQRLRDSIKAATLQNALEHDGKAKADAVIGKMLLQARSLDLTSKVLFRL